MARRKARREPPLDEDELALAQSHAASACASGAEAHRPDDELDERREHDDVEACAR